MVRKRLKEIDIASGIAILLVVTGHLSDYEPSWYGAFKGTLYKFHMPFFMFVSGFLLSYTAKNYETLALFKSFIIKKFKRFGLPYLFMSLIFLAVKYYLSIYDSATILTQGFKNIIIEPTSGPAIFLWYIFVLFQFYIIFPLLQLIPLIKRKLYLLVILGFALYQLKSITGLFELDLFCKYFLFFSIGFVISSYYNKVKFVLAKGGVFFLMVFVGLIALDIMAIIQIPSIILGLLAIPSILYVSILVNTAKYLEYIGSKTFVIYIWNSVLIFALSYALRALDSNYYTNFIFYAPILVFVGIFGPLFLRKLSRKLKLNFLNLILP